MRGAALAVAAMLVLAVGRGAAAADSSLTDEDVVSRLDELLKQSWRDAGVSPSPTAPDGPWARRVCLDLIGRVPTLDELRAFFAEPPHERRAWLVDRLLGREYTVERSRWDATQWAILLVGRTGGMRNNSPIHRESLEAYLGDEMRANRPHDEFMRELVTATGSVRPEDPDHNGAANFLVDKLGDDAVQATARTAQLFLGTSVQCTQCHNHPFNEQRQNQFWELNAFFRQTRFQPIREEDSNRRYGRVVNRDFMGEAGRRVTLEGEERAELYYELRNGRLKVAYPTFIDGTPLADVMLDRGVDEGDSGRLDVVDRRAELADLIARSDEFARVTVNREWARLLGYGMVRPPEDMGPHNPPSHPELLQTLADAFVRSGFDRSRLTRWIVSSRAYQLDSRAGRSNADDDPAAGVTPAFSRFYLRQLTPEQIYDSLVTATRADEGLSEEEADRARRRWLRQFTIDQGNDENGEATTFNGSISQTLAMMNSRVMRRATNLRGGDYDNQTLLASIAWDDTLSDAERIDRLYLAALARKPTRDELRLAQSLLAKREGDVAETLRDVWWALLNSNEFILNH
ncbi:MAG: DUF1549 domain-containing protein [Planctomycetota bacterium]